MTVYVYRCLFPLCYELEGTYLSLLLFPLCALVDVKWSVDSTLSSLAHILLSLCFRLQHSGIVCDPHSVAMQCRETDSKGNISGYTCNLGSLRGGNETLCTLLCCNSQSLIYLFVQLKDSGSMMVSTELYSGGSAHSSYAHASLAS